MANFAWERLLMSLGAVGGDAAAVEVTVAYASERRRSAGRSASFQAIRHKVAEMATKPEAPRPHLPRAARLRRGRRRDARGGDGEAAHPARLLEVADECLQIHGGYGYMREYGIERACATRASARSAAAPTR